MTGSTIPSRLAGSYGATGSVSAVRAGGTGLVLVTHDAPLADALADERLQLGSA